MCTNNAENPTLLILADFLKCPFLDAGKNPKGFSCPGKNQSFFDKGYNIRLFFLRLFW
jgi:hypothetical protein